jgi:hypothetical protein
MKCTDSGRVRSSDQFELLTTLDAYGGNSGSAVLNLRTHKVEGLLLAGASDFRLEPDQAIRTGEQCYTSAVYQDGQGTGERVRRIHVLADRIPRR